MSEIISQFKQMVTLSGIISTITQYNKYHEKIKHNNDTIS